MFKIINRSLPQKSPKSSRLYSKSEYNASSKPINPAIKDLNSYVPDLLKAKPLKASKLIFSNNNAKNTSKNQYLVPENLPLREIEQFSWSEELSNRQDDINQDFSGFLLESNEKKILPNQKSQLVSTPLEYYQNFKVKNMHIIDSLEPKNYVAPQVLISKINQSFHSEENVEEAKFINFDRGNSEVPEKRVIEEEGNISDLIEIEVLMNEFNGLNEKSFNAYEKIIVNVEEYDNLISKKKQNHASFAFISLVFLRKMLRKFHEGCFCIENYLKAEKLFPQISHTFRKIFDQQIKTLKNWDFKNLDLDILLNPEGSFHSTLVLLASNLHCLQRILNHSKILYSSMTSSKNFEVPYQQFQEKNLQMSQELPQKGVLKNVNRAGNNPKSNDVPLHEMSNIEPHEKGALIDTKSPRFPNNLTKNNGISEKNSNMLSRVEITEKGKANQQTSPKTKKNVGSMPKQTFERPLELLKAFMEMRSLIISMLNIHYKQNLDLANLGEKLVEKDESLNERLERELNSLKSEEIVAFVNRVWMLFSENKAFFTKLESQYIDFLKMVIARGEKQYFSYFRVYQKLSFSMESLRKLCQLGLEEIKLLELETKEIFEKSIVKLDFPLTSNWKKNERTLNGIVELREKLFTKVEKLRKETKTMRKSLKNEYFYLLYLQKCDETLQKVGQIQHSLRYFAEVLSLLKESIPLEKSFRKLMEENNDYETQDLECLKKLKSSYIHLYQSIQAYKNSVSLLKQGFPTFFEIERECTKQLEILELNLRKISECIESKSPEILELVTNEIAVTENLIEKLKKALNSSLSLSGFIQFIRKNSQLNYEISLRSANLKRWAGIHGILKEKKTQINKFAEELNGFQTTLIYGEILVNVIERIKPEHLRKILKSLNLKEQIESKVEGENFVDWFRLLNQETSLFSTKTPLIESLMRNSRFNEVLMSYIDVYTIIYDDYVESSEKLKGEFLKTYDYAGKSRRMRDEILRILEKIKIGEEIENFFIKPDELLNILDGIFRDNVSLFTNQENSLKKLSRKNQVAKFKEKAEKTRANFLEKGIKAHTDERLSEMTGEMKEVKTYLQNFKTEIMQQKENKNKKNNYSITEVKELVLHLNFCIKSYMFMISLGGLIQVLSRGLNQIVDAFKNEEDVVMVISQKIKETANDVFLIKKRVKSVKAYIGTEFEDLFHQSNETIVQTMQYLSILYELLGEIGHFDGIFNDNGFEINAKSEEFCEGLSLFLNFSVNFPNKKKYLIETRQKLSEKVSNPELQELFKPMESINVVFSKIVESYFEEFDIEYLKYIEPKLKEVCENNILKIAKEIKDFIESFNLRIQNHDRDSTSLFIWMKLEIPQITLKIKSLMETLDSDFSYKGFLNANNKNKNSKVAKMLEVENLNECRNVTGKEKMRNWETILLTLLNVITIYLTEKTEEKLKSLHFYKEKLFALKKMNHSANKEMNFINAFEEIVYFDFKMNKTF